MYIITEIERRSNLRTAVTNDFLANELYSHSYYSPGKTRKNHTAKSSAGSENRIEMAPRRVATYQSRNSSVEWMMMD